MIVIKNINFYYTCMIIKNKPFISCIDSFLLFDGSSIRPSSAFLGWNIEDRAWNGTFITLTNSAFTCADGKLIDIVVHGENSVFLDRLGTTYSKRISLVKFEFIRCGCLNGGMEEGRGAPIIIILNENNCSAWINLTKIDDCFSQAGNVQGIYFKGPSTHDFVFNSSRMVYSTSVTDPVLYINFTDSPSDIPTDKFINFCPSVNAGDIIIGSKVLSPSSSAVDICPSGGISSPLSPLYNSICPCGDIRTCIINGIESFKCPVVEYFCENILFEGLCELPGTAVRNDNENEILTCGWIKEEEYNHQCQELKVNCEDITREIPCMSSSVTQPNEGAEIQCFWVLGNKTEDTCREAV
jgi:hypothetical protein